MLRELRISNFAIIEKQSILFAPGLNVISGETGAGKSIILNALELILGAKPKASLVRAGTEELEVEALFDLSSVAQSLREDLPDYAKGEELLVSRSVNAAGRSRVYLNGRLASLGLLEEVCSRLVNICGQGQFIRLMDPAYHLNLIDGFAEHEALKHAYRDAYRNWKDAAEQLASAQTSRSDAEKREIYLTDVVEELKPLGLKVGLKEELELEIRRLSSAEHVLQRCEQALSGLEGDPGPIRELGAVLTHLADAARQDDRLQEYHVRLQSVRADLQGLASDLGRFSSRIQLSGDRLEECRSRLSEISRVERKYRADAQSLLRILADAQQELRQLSSPLQLKEIEARVHQCRRELESKGAELSQSRKSALKRLVTQVEQELADLNMGAAKLGFAERKLPEPSPSGLEQLELLISTNKGEPQKSLKDVASGGELARITLVLKKVLRDRTGVNVLVFDEVDTGVSGKVARAMGEKLKSLAQDQSQVLCITHLPQVASLADHHFLVEKVEKKGRTLSLIRELSVEERVDEVARMLSGREVTDSARRSAQELFVA